MCIMQTLLIDWVHSSHSFEFRMRIDSIEPMRAGGEEIKEANRSPDATHSSLGLGCVDVNLLTSAKRLPLTHPVSCVLYAFDGGGNAPTNCMGVPRVSKHTENANGCRAMIHPSPLPLIFTHTITNSPHHIGGFALLGGRSGVCMVI